VTGDVNSFASATHAGPWRRYLAALNSPDWSEQLRPLYESMANVALNLYRALGECGWD
jgi:hypothetical protein